MKTLRVLNNNVVLALRDDNVAVVVTGLGIGHKAKPGSLIDEGRIQQVFVPENNRDSDHLAELVAAIPLDYVELASRLLDPAEISLEQPMGSATVVALADHLQMAVHWHRLSPKERDKSHPLAAEVTHLYPQELSSARRIITAANSWLESRGEQHLPESESISIALHLVNAGFRSGDLAETYAMTGLFGQLFDEIDDAFGITLDRQSVNSARFITHMRYFFVRAHEDKQINNDISVLRRSLALEHPDAVRCGARPT
ncbi:CAT RNA binding domain-containing protein [Corynebacterium lubricantis]|uniref:CAT RNA binding domain-containing protein n=1 Tax=Corynebacterium lubricantis TaxID=541095 RepID=UPI00039A1337|nr:CAT RNA binding domain-containing protein [Corynebacterium lubricantis]